MTNKLLMHQNIPCALVQVLNNQILDYYEIYSKDDLPIGTYSDVQSTRQLLIRSWYQSRSIPFNRPNLEIITSKIGMTAAEAFIKSSGISLTDTYWLKDEKDSIVWEDINYHNNGFSPIIANIILNNQGKFSESPDFTTDGMLEKFWLPMNGICLFKYDPTNLTTANEVFVSKIADYLQISHTSYFQSNFGDKSFCSCPCFVTNAYQDHITALQIKHSKLGTGNVELERIFRKDPNLSTDFEKMILLDCLIHNTDRHEKNFGVLKEKDGTYHLTPIYDNGGCLGYNRNINAKIIDNDLKMPRKDRKDILQSLSILQDLPPLDRQYFLELLRETYHNFSISYEKLKQAESELLYGCDLIEEILLQQNKVVENEYSYDIF